ncbi:hypothetical protein B0H17DRAFT_1342278 [Mycena rosella]|uniref:Uncharacterized protein n=1 Tax=Mycena rosella TaxID=1033263 RepID=A0AAD7AXX7_MYCRO|nr:hypothetical protein B0H17DRAFT_1342278 [Mycena rosella]
MVLPSTPAGILDREPGNMYYTRRAAEPSRLAAAERPLRRLDAAPHGLHVTHQGTCRRVESSEADRPHILPLRHLSGVKTQAPGDDIMTREPHFGRATWGTADPSPPSSSAQAAPNRKCRSGFSDVSSPAPPFRAVIAEDLGCPQSVAPRMTDERRVVLSRPLLWCLAPLSARSRVAAQLHLHLGRIALVATAFWYASRLWRILPLTPAFLSRSFYVMRDAHGRLETSGTAIFLCVSRFITLFLAPDPSPVFLYILRRSAKASGRARSRPHWQRHAGLRDVLNVGHLLDRLRAPTSFSLGIIALAEDEQWPFQMQTHHCAYRALTRTVGCARVRSHSDSVHRPRVQLILVRVGDRDRAGATVLIPRVRRVSARACERAASGERLWNVRASEGEQSQMIFGRLAAALARRPLLIALVLGLSVCIPYLIVPRATYVRKLRLAILPPVYSTSPGS